MGGQTCACHGSIYATCDYPGGCGSTGGCCSRTTARQPIPAALIASIAHPAPATPATATAPLPVSHASADPAPDPDHCFSGPHCKAYNPATGQPAPTRPLCGACLTAAERDTRALVYDYLDLSQLHEASLSQAITEKTAGSREKTMLLAAHVEALQAEIVHVVTTWETEVRAAARLSEPPTQARPGAHVQRAVGILAPRIRALSLLPATAAYRTGCEDPIEDIAGWEAVHHLQGLHGRAKATLGRTTRSFWIPGNCWTCGARDTPDVDGPLCRSEPRFPEDPMQVTCSHCRADRPYADYEHLQTHLRWPEQFTDLAKVAA